MPFTRIDSFPLTRPLRFALALLLAAPAFAQTVGSPLIDRPNNDASSGLTLIYRGSTQPLAGPAVATTWSFFDNESAGGKKVTPMIFEVTGASQWKVVAIGTPRATTGAGVQTHPFATQAGTTTLQPGKQYTIGFAHRDYTFAGGQSTPGAGYGGVVDFTGYSVFTDPWSYVQAATNLGTTVGTGGLAIDASGFTGRIYSASVSFAPLACGATTYCTAKLSSNQCLPSIGFSGTPSYAAAAGFTITTTGMETGVSAIDFFGTNGQTALPFHGGLICTAGQIFRMAGKNAGGAGTCSGSVSYTLQNIIAHPAGGALVTVGGLVNIQTWSRDMADPFGSNFSNALEILVCP